MNNGGQGPAGPVAKLIDQFHKLPGIGPKTAQRLTYYLVRMPEEEAKDLAEAIISVKNKISLCSKCFNITESDPCSICSDTRRDISSICVVEEAMDIVSLERTGSYNGLYHVLHGAISPMNGIGPDELKIQALLGRIDNVSEIILATNPNIEGEATAMYIHRLLNPFGISITRPARGLPVGGDLEYADDLTLGRALEGRESF
ncbi:MAG: recombination mediator RecR [Chloroflexota bacterium]|nr:recombination mediator RecR [Chloroflexota bacterium]